MMLKRDFAICRHRWISVLASVIVLCLIGYTAGKSVLAGAASGSVSFPVSVVDEDDSVLSRIALNMVSGQTNMEAMLTINREDRETALENLRTGNRQAVVILPDGYMDSIQRGLPGKGEIWISDSLQGSQEQIRRIAKIGTNLLLAGQTGIFSGEQLIAESRSSEDIHEAFLKESNSALLSFAAGMNESMFAVKEVSYEKNGMKAAGYYADCWIILVLTLCTVCLSPLFSKDLEKGIFICLRSAGVGKTAFLFPKIFFPFLYRLCLCLLIAWLTGQDLVWNGIGPMIGCLLYISLTVSLYSVAFSQKKGYELILVLISVTGLFLMGGIVPANLIPDYLLTAGAFTPFGTAVLLGAPLFGGSAGTFVIFPAVLYPAAGLYLANRRLEAALL